MPVAVAAMTAQPSVVRKPGLVEKSLATLCLAEWRARPKRNLGYRFACLCVDDRDGIGKRVGQVNAAAVGAWKNRRGALTDIYILPLVSRFTPDRQLMDAAQSDE